MNLQSSPSPVTISPYIFTVIATELKGRPLFPKLRRIHVDAPDDSTAWCSPLPLILTQDVTEVAFEGNGLVQALFSGHSLPVAARQLLSLKHFSLKNTKTNMPQKILDHLVHMQHLTSLELHLPHTGLEGLSATLWKLGQALVNLETMSVDLHMPDHNPKSTFNFFATRFLRHIP